MAKVIQAGIEPTTACVLCKTGVITTTPLNRCVGVTRVVPGLLQLLRWMPRAKLVN